MTMKLPDQEMLRKLLRYEPETGKLFWRERPVSVFSDGKYTAERICRTWNTKHAGKEAFTAMTCNGYRQGRIFYQHYKAHRVIFAMQTGECPEEIDHENHIRDNNRWENLQEATKQDNGRNQSLHSTNTSGFCGVSWNKYSKKWMAYITVQGRRIHLGYYDTKEEAIAAREQANVDYGFHPNHGR